MRAHASVTAMLAVVATAATGAAAGACDGGFNITEFGGVPGVDTHAQAVINGAALQTALEHANASSSVGAQRSVLVPAGQVFSFLPAAPTFQGLHDVTLCLEGTMNLSTANFSKQYPGWPDQPWVPVSFTDCDRVSVISETGKGLVNGRGSEWWWYQILEGGNRPHLFGTSGCKDFRVEGISLLNAPSFHMYLGDVVNAEVTGVTVLVDLDDQLDALAYIAGADQAESSRHEVLQAAMMARDEPASVMTAEAHGRRHVPERVMDFSWAKESWRINPPFPMVYALNTDGIDFQGTNVTVTGCNVTNFDDSVCAKPTHPGRGRFGTACTSDVSISDIHITYGVGVSMGSVPPDNGGNCISEVHIQNVTFEEPLKAVYIKPNPAHAMPAKGTITNVVYEDITVNTPLWWFVWISTQQQDQPHGTNTGCSFLYPLFNSSCPTDPEVTVGNITLRNVEVFTPLLSPGVLRLNASNPGFGIVFDNVVVHDPPTWPIPEYYICEAVAGIATGGTTPVPPCFSKQ